MTFRGISTFVLLLLLHSEIKCIVVVVRNKAINHLHERGPDRRTVCQSIPIYIEARGSHASTLSLS